MTHDPAPIVRAFCAAWVDGDIDRLCAMLAPDVEWENVPIGILHGRAAARARIEAAFVASPRIDWQVKAIAVTEDGLVMTERVDILHMPGGEVRIPLMGVFRVGAGGITLWRDYFDAAIYRADCERAGAVA